MEDAESSFSHSLQGAFKSVAELNEVNPYMALTITTKSFQKQVEELRTKENTPAHFVILEADLEAGQPATPLYYFIDTGWVIHENPIEPDRLGLKPNLTDLLLPYARHIYAKNYPQSAQNWDDFRPGHIEWNHVLTQFLLDINKLPHP